MATRGPYSLLHALAVRVRSLRDLKGWTRAQLAQRSGMSVRFLAKVESGKGNISLLRLAGLAEALGTAVEQLVRPGVRPGGLVALAGLRGAGKSTVGPLLARRLEVPFVEMDDVIRDASGLPLDQLFELHGERYYRRLERETLGRVLRSEGPAVLATAGGVVTEAATWDLLLRHATVVWLKADPEEHWTRVIAQGDRRPMADHPDAMTELRAMLAAREPLYARAHLTVDTIGRTPDEVAASIEHAITSSSMGLLVEATARRAASS